MQNTSRLLKELLALPPYEKARLIDKLISSLDQPDNDIDKLWASEAEDRLDAFESGKIKTIELEKVLGKYR